MIEPVNTAAGSAIPGLPPTARERRGATPGVDPQVSSTVNRNDTGTNNVEMRQYASSPASPLEDALESINDSLQAWSTGMRFEMDDDAQRLVVSIIDSSTGKVLRQIPSEAVLQVARMIVKLQGTGVDTHA